MADERTAEPAPGTPGQRALGAMESAVRRARESAGAAPLPTPPTPGPRPATGASATLPRERRVGRRFRLSGRHHPPRPVSAAVGPP